jgi:hypothetical protein
MEQVGDNIALFVSPVDEEVKRTIPYTTFGFLFFIFLQIDLMHICRRKFRGSDSERPLPVPWALSSS